MVPKLNETTKRIEKKITFETSFVCRFVHFFLYNDFPITYKCLYGNNSVYKFTQIGAHCILCILHVLRSLSVSHCFDYISILLNDCDDVEVTTGQWQYLSVHLFVVHVHKMWLLTCQNSHSSYQHTCESERNRRKHNETDWESEIHTEKKKKQKQQQRQRRLRRWRKKRRRKKIQHTLRIERKMQALHGAIWNWQNHNIDCCTFCRAVNPFASDTHSVYCC